MNKSWLRKILVSVFIILNLESYSKSLDSDSLNIGAYRKLFYIQADFALPIFALITNQYWERQSVIYNVSTGWLLKRSLPKRIKKSIQINVFSYIEKNVFTLTSNSKIGVRDFDIFISPEIKFLFNKKFSDKGMYATTGIGLGTHKHYENNKLSEQEHAWDLIFSLGYNLPIKRFYLDFKIGAGSFFSYKTIYHVNSSGYTYYERPDPTDPSVKKVEYIDSSTTAYSFKHLGLRNASFIPNFGIQLGFRF